MRRQFHRAIDLRVEYDDGRAAKFNLQMFDFRHDIGHDEIETFEIMLKVWRNLGRFSTVLPNI